MNIKHGISLDPTFFMGKYPLPSSKTDIAVGMAIHMGYQVTEWSERFRAAILQELSLPPIYEFKFNLFFDMAEKIYADLLSNRNMLGLYTEKHRKWEIRNKYKQFITPPTVEELLHIWWRMAADRKKDRYKEEYIDSSVGGLSERTSLSKFYRKPLALLNSIIGPLKYECPELPTVSERGAFRLALYRSIWNVLLSDIRFWPGNRADPFMLYDKYEEEIAKEEEDKKAVKSTLISYAEEIERTLNKGLLSYTQEVKSIVANMDDVVEIEGNDISMPAEYKVDKKLLNNLRVMPSCFSTNSTACLKTGKVDGRRLYRSQTTGNVFMLKKNVFALSHNIVLLLDCTGSMSDPAKWDHAQTIFQTLFVAIKEFNPKARVIGYNEVKNTCRITELYHSGMFFTVFPNGKTASGEAIMATVLSMKRIQNFPIIIHITDGASNWGCGVAEAVAFCKKKKVNLLTLGIGCSPSAKQALKQEYGQHVEFADNIQAIPRFLRTLMNHCHCAA